VNRFSPLASKLGPKNYLKVVTGRIVEHAVNQWFVFFDSTDAVQALQAYTRAVADAPPGAVISTWAHTPGVPSHVPVIGDFYAELPS
jgi:hypothetical protein